MQNCHIGIARQLQTTCLLYKILHCIWPSWHCLMKIYFCLLMFVSGFLCFVLFIGFWGTFFYFFHFIFLEFKYDLHQFKKIKHFLNFSSEYLILNSANVIIIPTSTTNWTTWIRARKFKEIAIIVGTCLSPAFVPVSSWFADTIGARSDLEQRSHRYSFSSIRAPVWLISQEW